MEMTVVYCDGTRVLVEAVNADNNESIDREGIKFGADMAVERYPARTSKPKRKPSVKSEFQAVSNAMNHVDSTSEVLKKRANNLKNLIDEVKTFESNKQPFFLRASVRERDHVAEDKAVKTLPDPHGFLGSPDPSGAPCAIRERLHNGTIIHRRVRILLSVSKAYMPALLNWLVYYRAVCPGAEDLEKLFFLCFDRGAESLLLQRGLYCGHVDSTHSKNQMWLLRTRVTNLLLLDGADVLISDLDALWLRNPFPVSRSAYITISADFGFTSI